MSHRVPVEARTSLINRREHHKSREDDAGIQGVFRGRRPTHSRAKQVHETASWVSEPPISLQQSPQLRLESIRLHIFDDQ